MLSTSTSLAEPNAAFNLPVEPAPAPSVNDMLDDLAAGHPEPSSVGTGIFKLFEHAISKRLKYPKIRLRATDDQVVVLRLAGAKSKYCGEIQITDEGRFPDNRYFGRIDCDGMLCPGRDMTAAVNELLGRLAADPARVAFEYGKRTGRCCFCDSELSDSRSMAHGFGPVCAKRYGFGWNAERDERRIWSAGNVQPPA